MKRDWLEARVDGFGFQGEDAEDAFMDAAEGFETHEAFEGLDAQCEIHAWPGTVCGRDRENAGAGDAQAECNRVRK